MKQKKGVGGIITGFFAWVAMDWVFGVDIA